MNALEVIENITNTSLFDLDLKYCLVNKFKEPYRIDNTLARPNVMEDFVSLEQILSCNRLRRYNGLGISIQASNICAIDVDHCFSEPNDIFTADERATDILKMFKDVAYCEYSFSGTGLRIFFKASIIKDYSEKFYIKNSSNGIEYYQPNDSYRYVTVTGNAIYDKIDSSKNIDEVIQSFLNKYMQKPIKIFNTIQEIKPKSSDELKKDIRVFYLKNTLFQNLWFGKAPGSGKNESELDYQLIAFIYENLTQDKAQVKETFESSPYFKSKDDKHIYKWKYNDYRYFEYIFKNISQ